MITVSANISNINITVSMQEARRVNLTTVKAPNATFNIQQYPNITIVAVNVEELEERVVKLENFKIGDLPSLC